MVIVSGCDCKGPYVRWGCGTKYYYDKTDQDSYVDALNKAHRQDSEYRLVSLKGNRIRERVIYFNHSSWRCHSIISPLYG